MVSPFSPTVVLSLIENTLSAPSSCRNAATCASRSFSSRMVAKILIGVANVLTLIIAAPLVSALRPERPVTAAFPGGRHP